MPLLPESLLPTCPPPSRGRRARLALLLAGTLALAACGTSGAPPPSPGTENFGSTTTHTRHYDASEAQTCEAARRALLSQGYLLSAASAEGVTGRKSFQPSPELHLEVEMRVVCAPDNRPGQPPGTVAFASALQERFGLKKSSNAASVGVGGIGSLSLPFAAGDDSLIKVASETLTDAKYYERFFALVDRFLTGRPVKPAAGEDDKPPAGSKR